MLDTEISETDYIRGIIHGHNVIIVALPAGVPRSCDVASVAVQLSINHDLDACMVLDIEHVPDAHDRGMENGNVIVSRATADSIGLLGGRPDLEGMQVLRETPSELLLGVIHSMRDTYSKSGHILSNHISNVANKHMKDKYKRLNTSTRGCVVHFGTIAADLLKIGPSQVHEPVIYSSKAHGAMEVYKSNLHVILGVSDNDDDFCTAAHVAAQAKQTIVSLGVNLERVIEHEDVMTVQSYNYTGVWSENEESAMNDDEWQIV
jgi:hypothetical protein